MKTIKQKYRDIAGYVPTHSCGECKYCICELFAKKRRYKCLKMGITGSSATDIRLKDCACGNFEEDKKREAE